jgi:DNA-binding transcriptional LysR family regulator
MDWSARIGRRLTPRDLHFLLTVVEAGSMAKAAALLGCSRPVVSRTIADLEAVLAVKLLDRTSSGIEPTQYGKALISRSAAVFDELRQSVKEIEFLADPSAGELRIGIPEVPAGGIVPVAIARLAQRFPKMTVLTQQGANDAILGHLRERRSEVALVRPPSRAPDLEICSLLHERLFVVTGLGNSLCGARKLDLHQLLDAPWIQSYAEISPGGPTFEAFSGHGLPIPRCIVVSDSLNLRYGLLKTGRFITMIPGSVLHYGPSRTEIKVLPVKPLQWSTPTAVATLKDRTLSPLAKLFIEEMKLLAAPLCKPS